MKLVTCSSLSRLVTVFIAAFAASQCGGSGPLGSPTAPSALVSLAGAFGAQSAAVLIAAGDIALCGSPGSEATARLLDDIPGTVLALGDLAYMSGTDDEFRRCYGPTWGRHRDRTRPTPGNHEYRSAGADGYFNYFASSAGPRGQGFYSYSAGSWFVVSLNSEVDVAAGSAQLTWLRDQLSHNRTECTAAYWHRPLFSSGPNGPNADLREAWRVLYEFDVDVVLNGHDHLYERFAPQDPDGRPDPARGIRQFTVGTGGSRVYSALRTSANSEVIGSVFGVATLTLGGHGYQWEFVPADGGAFRDAGAGQCH